MRVRATGRTDGTSGGGSSAIARLTAASLFLGLLIPVGASAQYFGRNKVQYENFDWKVMTTEHFDIHFYPEEQDATVDGARMAERWQTRLEQAFQHKLSERKPIVYYADHPDFQQTNVISGLISEGTGGVTEALKNRMTLPFTGVYEDNDHVIGHEMVHVFQYDIAGGQGGMSGLSAMGRLPLWMVEGMAEYLSQGRVDAHTAMWMRDAALRDDLPTIQQITRDPRYFPYRYGEALLAYVGGLYGDGAVTALFRNALRGGWEASVRAVLGMTSDSLSRQWIAATRDAYLPSMEGRTLPKETGERVLAEDLGAGEMNVAPSLSPDGRYVAFLTEKDLFSIDYYIADAHTGKLIRKLASSTSDPHFDALSFLQSAGTWSPDGRQFAYVVFAEGNNELAIADAQSGDVERRIAIEGVGSIKDPAWSPDGRTIAFAGLSGGISDLYLLDVESGQTRQLTNDRYADIQPAWSPDGRTLAFATDRGPGTDFSRLTFGPIHLALYSLDGGSIDLLPTVEDDAKHINPQWSPDGRSIYTIADRSGFSDVYRLDVGTGQYYQVTNVATGVSGITDLSSALTVASRDGRVMFSIFGDQQYTVSALTPEQAVGTPVESAPSGTVDVARVLPPVDAYGRGLVFQYKHDDLTGLPGTSDFEISDYDSNLTLDYVGAPTIGAGYSPTFGTGFAGAVSFLFSDLLGNRELGVAIQAQGSEKDIGGQAVYINAENRWNWGVQASHIPYLSGAAGFRTDASGNQQYVEQLQRIYISQLEGLTQYPFSTTRRFEASAGYTRYAYNVEEDRYTLVGNQITGRRTVSLDSLAPPDMHLFNATAAYVGDNSFAAFTSPVAGSRYRFELTPTVGTLDFVSALADYRKYFFFNPLTVAFRAMHYGYYFGDENDARLRNGLFLGYETLVRGYAYESFSKDDCPSSASATQCPAFRRLVGSRIAVFNAELRIPILGVEEFGLINFPYLPMELAPFFDAGLAWCGSSPSQGMSLGFSGTCGPGPNVQGDDQPELKFATDTDARVPVFSAGVSSRFNILGYIILEVYYAYPFQRPNKGWHFGFNISPGW